MASGEPMEIDIDKLDDGTYLYVVKTDDQVRHIGKAPTTAEAYAQIRVWLAECEARVRA
jgi:hypothetical protein